MKSPADLASLCVLDTHTETKVAIHRLIHLKSGLRRLAGIALAIASCWSVAAEERSTPDRFQVEGLLEKHFSEFHPSSLILSLAEPPSGLPSGGLFRLADRLHLTAIIENALSEIDLEADSSIMLFRKPMSAHYAYHRWAGFRTGYGQYFTSDSFGRSRTNGVGLHEPDFFYLKMSVRF